MPGKKTAKPKVTATKPPNSKSASTKSLKPKQAIPKTKLASKSVKPKPLAAKPPKSEVVVVKPQTDRAVAQKAVKLERTDVFVSYSHADKEWLTRLQVHLKPLEREYKINIWADTKLRGGDKWRDEINKALAKAKVAILLVSADFMASDFIASNELPPLLKSAQKEGVLILPVILGHSGGFAISGMAQFQAMNDPSLPLENMSKGQSEQVFAQLFKRIYEAFQQTTSKSVQLIKTESVEPPTTTQRLRSKRNATAELPVTPIKKKASLAKTKKALLVKQNGDWEVMPIVRSEVATNLTLVIKATTAQQRAFLTSLRNTDQLSGVVLDFQSYLCKNASVQVKTEGTQETWHIRTDLQQQNRRAQVTFSSITPEMQAELKARLLLLDEPISSDQLYYRHVNMLLDFESSPFPALYQRYNKQSEPFKQAATLIATLFLQINNIVEHILNLELSVKANILTVRFEGQRSAQYQEKPDILKISGTCYLLKPVLEKSLQLGPLNRY